MIPTKEQNPNGLHQRYIVSKADGTDCGPDAVYFVLRLDGHGDDALHIESCRKAALAYASHASQFGHLYQLATDVRELVERLKREAKEVGR